MPIDIQNLKNDFCKVLHYATLNVDPADIIPEDYPVGQRPTILPAGQRAIYIFFLGDHCLKVGQAGPNSQGRFTTHHYDPHSSESNLAKSLLMKNPNVLTPEIIELLGDTDEDNIGNWMLSYTKRYHYFLPKRTDKRIVNLFEIFLQCRLRAIFG